MLFKIDRLPMDMRCSKSLCQDEEDFLMARRQCAFPDRGISICFSIFSNSGALLQLYQNCYTLDSKSPEYLNSDINFIQMKSFLNIIVPLMHDPISWCSSHTWKINSLFVLIMQSLGMVRYQYFIRYPIPDTLLPPDPDTGYPIPDTHIQNTCK